MKLDKKFDFFINTINQKLFEFQNYTFNNAEVIVLKGIWKSQTYSQIAKEKGYSSEYLANVVAPQLCHRLSHLVGQRITKKNCRALIESYATKQMSTETTSSSENSPQFVFNQSKNMLPSYPSGSVCLDSCFYIKRFNIEEKLYEEVCKPGALIRIKAPKEMGKTSLVLRVLDYADRQGYQTVSLNLEQIEKSVIGDLDRFLRWLCANISYQLNLEPKLDQYWDEDVGSKVSCTLYFRNYILKQIDSPLVLALDDLHHIFEYSLVAKDFLPLLRSWYEEAKRTPIWQKLRLIVVHSTEVYIPLHINQSPFNVGLPIQLKNFNLVQVKTLAEKYQLNWQSEKEAEQLINLVGGHPALIQIALYHLSHEEITLEKLLQTASTSQGIYHCHLRRQWLTLQQEPELAEVFKALLQTNQPLQLKPIITYKLSSMGLIKQIDNKVIVSCQLYQDCFTRWSQVKELSKLSRGVESTSLILGKDCFNLDKNSLSLSIDKSYSTSYEFNLAKFAEMIEAQQDNFLNIVFDSIVAAALSTRNETKIGCKLTEQKLTMQMLQLILDTIPQRIFWKDKNLRYLGCNKLFAQDAGLESPRQIVGKNDFELAWQQSADLYRADDMAVIQNNISKINYKEPQAREDGTTIWLKTSKIPLQNQTSEVIGVFGCYWV
jgi:PAS domain-containing protein